MRLWLGPWQWVEDETGFFYNCPENAKNLIDLRPIDKQAIGNEEGLSIFVADEGVDLGSEYKLLGRFDDKAPNKIWKDVFGVNADKTTLWGNIRDLVLENSVPGSRNPITPFGKKLSIIIPGAGKWEDELPQFNRHNLQKWSKIIECMKLSIEKQANEDIDYEVDGKRILASKFLAIRARQLELSHEEAKELLVPTRLKNKISNIEPETSDSDYFNYSNIFQSRANYNMASDGSVFEAVFGTGSGWGVSSSNGFGGANVYYRWLGTALSSTDQVCRCGWTYKNAGASIAGGMLRSTAFSANNGSAAAVTNYHAFIRAVSGIVRPQIAKAVSGTRTGLATGTNGETYNAQSNRPIEFSVIGSDLEIIAATETGGANQTLSATDSSITTGLYFGVYQKSGHTGGTGGVFGIPGAYDYSNSRGYEWEDYEASTPLSKNTIVVLSHSLSVDADKNIGAEHILELSSDKSIPIELLGGFAINKDSYLEHLAPLSGSNTSLLDHILNTDIDKNVLLEHLAGLSNNSSITIEHLINLSAGKDAIVSYGVGLTNLHSITLEHLLNLYSDSKIIIEHLLKITKDNNVSIEHLLSLNNNSNISLEHILNFAKDNNIPIEHLLGNAALSVNKIAVIEHLLNLSKSIVVPQEHTLIVAKDTSTPLEHILSLSENKNLPLEHLLTLESTKVINTSHGLILSSDLRIPLESALTFSAASQINFEHLLLISKETGIPIEHLVSYADAMGPAGTWIIRSRGNTWVYVSSDKEWILLSR